MKDTLTIQSNLYPFTYAWPLTGSRLFITLYDGVVAAYASPKRQAPVQVRVVGPSYKGKLE